MSLVVKISDFDSGINAVSYNGYQSSDFQWYIDKYEKHYLSVLLGVDLYNLFIADLDGNGVPQTPIYQAIYNEINEQINNEILVNRGMKEMLKGFIYFHYVRDNATKQTTTGNKIIEGDSSMAITALSANINLQFNDSIDDYRVIQHYINENEVDYPDFLGQNLGYNLNL